MPYRVENIVRKGEIACHNGFHGYISLVCQNVAFYGNELTALLEKAFENIVGKGENACKEVEFFLLDHRPSQ